MHKYLIFACIFLIFATQGFGQRYNFMNYNRLKDKDFEQNQILCIFQDSRGFMWFGSGVGLTRYDGEEWLHFSVHDGLPANEVMSIAEDDSLNLWVGTGFGLIKLNISDYNLPVIEKVDNKLSNTDINTLIFQNHTLWIGTIKNGLYYRKEGKIHEHKINDLYPNVTISDIKFSNEGNPIIIIGDKGLFILKSDGDAIRTVRRIEGKVMTCLYPIPENNDYIVGTNDGIYRYASKANRFYSLLPACFPVQNPYIHRVTIDNKGIIWVATNVGVLKITKHKCDLITKKHGLPINTIREVYVDRENNYWFGSYNSGVFKLSNQNIISYDENSGLESAVVNTILKESDQVKLIGTDSGIYRIDDLNLSRDERFEKLNDEIIWFIYRDKKGAIWIAGENTFNVYRKGKLIADPIPGLDHNYIFFDMIQDMNDNYWFGTSAGLFMYSGKKLKRYQIFDEHKIANIWEINQLSDGRILFGTDNGYVEYDGKNFRFVTKEDGLPDRAVYVVHEDRQGQVWLGCDLGIIKVDENDYKLYGRDQGLTGTIIAQVLEDEKGTLWLCSDKGLEKFENCSVTFRLSSHDGLIGEEFTTQNSSLIDSDGKFWLGVFGGLTVFDPVFKDSELSHPKVYLKKANYHGKDSKPISFLYNEQAVIPFSQNNVIFDFIGLYYYDEKDIRFSYILEGSDTEWTEIGRAGDVRYNNLAPGLYKFKVKGYVGNNIQSENTIVKQFRIEKPFWMQVWFILLVVIILLFIGALIIRYRTNRFRRINIQLEKKIAQRTRELALTKATLENIIEYAGSAIITINKKGKITTWNKRAEQVFLHSKKSILGKSISILDIKEDPFPFSDIINEVKKSGELHQLEIRKQGRTENISELIITVTPLIDENDDIYSYTLAMEDFSERNRVMNAILNREKLLAGIEALNKLLVTLSHYINNSIMAINGMAQLASLDSTYYDKFTKTTKQQVYRIQAVLKSLSKLVHQLNLKTRDYVGEEEKLFDIEDEIQEFLSLIEK